MSTAKVDPKYSRPVEGRPAITVARKGAVLDASRAKLLEQANLMQVAEA